MTYQELGQFIKQERKKLNLTQQGLAKLSDISLRTLQIIEAGGHVYFRNLEKVMDILGYNINQTVQVSKK